MTADLIQMPLKCFCRMFSLKGDAHHAAHPNGEQWTHTRTRCGPETALVKRTHATLAPSKAHRWIQCPGSLMVMDDDPETEWAAEGTRKHAVLYRILKGDAVIAGDIIPTEAGDYKVPKEVLEQCADIREFIEQWRQLDGTLVIERETPVEIGSYYWANVPRGLCHGMVDAAAYNSRELLVLDGKFGFVRVEAKDNPQLYLYALGLLAELSYLPIEHVTLCIAQPGWDGEVEFREHRMTADVLRQWAFDLTYVVTEIREGSRRLNASDDHACRYCPARSYCPPRLKALDDFSTDEWMQTHKLDDLLPFVPRLRAIVRDLEQKAMTELAAGRPVRGYKLVESKSKRKWMEEEAVPVALATLPHAETGHYPSKGELPFDFEPFEKVLLSPAKLERALRDAGITKKDREAIVAPLAFVPRGAPKLVPESDPRPALTDAAFTADDGLLAQLEASIEE